MDPSFARACRRSQARFQSFDVRQAGEAKAPGSLRDTIVEKLKESPESSWDKVVFGLAQDAYDEEGDGDE